MRMERHKDKINSLKTSIGNYENKKDLLEKERQAKIDTKALEEFVQQTMFHLKYSSTHVISCGLGVALGGGCELLLHSSFIIGNQELNAGLVELGVGLIPRWVGVTEIFARTRGDKTKLIKNIRNII
ncbi:Fatty acid oxidation complex subunit alpha [Rickettsia monacensis]|uniref:Fatty acid oxidation complex subunit alpha n=1 Tax=Rickettsia monacensis TaxID=109232 RepID=A0A0B7J547_9RICK|nr:hypothetical protein RMONA_7240 [Rickettsia monacensis IrR/Munich]CEO17588.1 Fatty acid oxidation complex subunit alpha [Rickettsia monacensis]